jgi:hypothetical protein
MSKVKITIEQLKGLYLFLFHCPAANKHGKLLRYTLPPIEANRHLNTPAYLSHFAYIYIAVKDLVIFFVYNFE